MRQEGWENRLEELVQSKRNLPFDWAENNCMQLVTEAQQTLTGQTDFPEALQNVGTKHSAYKLVLKRAKNLTELMDKHFKRVPITMAQRGDIVDIETCEGPAMGICMGGHAVFVGEKGIEHIPLTSLIRAWRM